MTTLVLPREGSPISASTRKLFTSIKQKPYNRLIVRVGTILMPFQTEAVEVYFITSSRACAQSLAPSWIRDGRILTIPFPTGTSSPSEKCLKIADATGSA